MQLEFTLSDCFEYLVADSVDVQRVWEEAKNGKQLKVKLGIDPTSTNLHVGRAIPLWRLRAFQELGHQIQLVIGDFTALVGDTSDKDGKRPMLTKEQVQANLVDYEKQLWMVLNPEKKDLVTFSYNSSWLGELSFSKIAELADVFTVNQFIKRELIARRIEAGNPVSLREMLYPLMQGYDSVMLESDIEIGGSDQWFNLLAGRTLQEYMGQAPQAVITNILINGADGQKMSSSLGNIISLNQPAFGMYTQCMQLADAVMKEYLAVFPRSARPFTEEEFDSRLGSGENPKNLKQQMAVAMVDLFYGEGRGAETQQRWEHERTELPTEISEFSVVAELSLTQLLVDAGLTTSKSEARRLLEQRGVRLDGNVCEADIQIVPGSVAGKVLQVGKHSFVRLQS